jgi:hypothetical protein
MRPGRVVAFPHDLTPAMTPFLVIRQKSRTLFLLSWATKIQIPKGIDRPTSYRHYRKEKFIQSSEYARKTCLFSSELFTGTIIRSLHSYVEIFPQR